MIRRTTTFPGRMLMFASAVLLVSGCANTAIRGNFESAQAVTRDKLEADVQWLTTDEARRQARSDTDRLLAQPLSGDDAVRIALGYSPAVQAMLFEAAAASAGATQAARLPNPVFSFEHLLRNEGGLREIEIGRVLAFSVYDLVLLPTRLRLADHQQAQTRLELAARIVAAATDARQAWIRAVAAQQRVQYFGQVKSAADASAELARRMQAVGNFSKLQRAREQAFSADAVAQLARAQQAARSTREALVRALGLDASQALAMTLPDRLPDLPAKLRDEQAVMQAALDQRLDVRIAKANLEFTAREQGLTQVTSFVNSFDVAGVRNTETGREPQKGYALDVALPIFDFGDAARTRAAATYMAALNHTAQSIVEASSQVRETYAAYRTADDVAKHYRDEIVPLHKVISEENMLRYNGMLIGVFELLADAREQIASVVQAIDAQQDFWLADADLQAALIGRPLARVASETGSMAGRSAVARQAMELQ